MALLLLDSSVIFDHLNGRFGRTEFLCQLIEQGYILACCPVNLTEVYAGLQPGEEDKTETFLNALEFLPVTQKSPGKPVYCGATGGRKVRPFPTRM
jgi:predicted nucleic acid-binding protein